MLSYQCFRELSERATSDPVNPYKEKHTNTVILISMTITVKAIVAAWKLSPKSELPMPQMKPCLANKSYY